jgi:hypothetical protein
MTTTGRRLLLVAAGLASLLALVTLAVDAAPAPLTVPAVLVFCLLAPGAVVCSQLGLPDRLLSLVVLLVTGPALWTLVATVQAFAGWWAPRATLMVAAVWLLVVALALLTRTRTRDGAGQPTG